MGSSFIHRAREIFPFTVNQQPVPTARFLFLQSFGTPTVIEYRCCWIDYLGDIFCILARGNNLRDELQGSS